ncbi:MAG: outer membrane beta-barrel protein [Verrucomicrobiota bacterium]
MKNFVLGALALTAFAGTSFAAVTLADNVNLFLTGKVGVSYDDNIQLGDGTINPKIDDTIFNVVPGLSIEFGQRKQAIFTVLDFNESLTRYVDNTNLNTSLASVSLRSTMKDPKTSGDFNAAYSQLVANTPVSGVPGLLRRNVTNVGGSIKFSPSGDKSHYGLGVTYDHTDYLGGVGLVNSKTITVPADYSWAVDAKQNLSLGVRYRKTELAGATPDFTDYYYNMGWNSEVTAKLNGNASIGLNQRKPQVGKDESSLGFNSTLNWRATEKTSVGFNLSNDFGSSSAGQSQRALNLGVNATTELASNVTGTAKATYTATRYPGTRKDDYWQYGVSVGWKIGNNFEVTAAYDYKDNSSSIGGANSYVDNLVSLTGTVRY